MDEESIRLQSLATRSNTAFICPGGSMFTGMTIESDRLAGQRLDNFFVFSLT